MIQVMTRSGWRPANIALRPLVYFSDDGPYCPIRFNHV